MNRISSKPQWPLKQIQCQPDFSTAFSPASSRGSVPSSGSVLSQPTCSGPARPPFARRWPTATPISTSSDFASQCEHVHLGQKPNSLPYFTEQPGPKQLMLHYQRGPHLSTGSLVTIPASHSGQTKQKTLLVSEELLLFQFKTRIYSLSSNT